MSLRGRLPFGAPAYRSGLLRMNDVYAISPPDGDHAGKMFVELLCDTTNAFAPSKSMAMIELVPLPFAVNAICEPKKPGSCV